MTNPPILAAEFMRRRFEKGPSRSIEKAPPEPKVDIDDEIQRLEAELQRDDDSSESSNSTDEEGDGKVLSLSFIEKERIGKLPEHLLPSSKKRSLKGIDRPSEPSKRNKTHEPKDGLKSAVKEFLDGYKPRSAEKLPFYCRVCAKQYTSELDFVGHQTSQFHLTAVDVERRASFCKLCRKQLTSPAQLKEHLSSKPHKNRLLLLRSKQPKK